MMMMMMMMMNGLNAVWSALCSWCILFTCQAVTHILQGMQLTGQLFMFCASFLIHCTLMLCIY